MKRHKRLIVHRQAVVNNLTTGKPLIKGNNQKLTVIPPNAVVKNFTMTTGQISVGSVGFRAAPAVGVLAPDADFGGGSIILIQATTDDAFRVQNTGGVPFAGTTGDLYVRIGPYVGYGRIRMHWDIDLYSAVVPGIYSYLESQIALSTGMIVTADAA